MYYPTLNGVKPTELNNTVPIKPLQETLPSYLTEIYPIVRSRGASLTRLGNTNLDLAMQLPRFGIILFYFWVVLPTYLKPIPLS